MPKKRLVLQLVPVSPHGWKVTHGEEVLFNTLGQEDQTKKDAIKFAVGYAREHKPSQVVIHGRDGKIQSERTYGNDPVRSKG